jgi:hypothetical protein
MATPPDFTAGAILTAAQMNAIGVFRITTCTVTSAGGTSATASNGVITVGAGNTSITVDNAFSADYDVYRVVYSGGVGSTTADLGLRLGAATTNYAYQLLFGAYANVAQASGGTGADKFPVVGGGSSSIATLDANILSPFDATKFTTISSIINSGSGAGPFTGQHRTAASYSGFTIIPSAGNLTGGKIRVYGIRN